MVKFIYLALFSRHTYYIVELTSCFTVIQKGNLASQGD